MNVKRAWNALYRYLTILALKTRAVTKPAAGFVSVYFGKVLRQAKNMQETFRAFNNVGDHVSVPRNDACNVLVIY